MITSELAKSHQWLVIEPRPKVGARPETVEEWHTRVWLSMATMPRERANF